jgi:SPP1 gp7 family putative phage head morphogenesis protein
MTKQESPRIGPPRIGRAERDFMRQLRSVARHVGDLVKGFEAGNAESLPALMQLLRAYSDALTPWAVSTVKRMLGEVNARDRDAWRSLATAISTQLRHEILNTDVGTAARALLHEQVQLIKSLPIEAGERVHELTLRGLEDSTRAAEVAAEIARTGEVTESRAMLIARTEVARTASVLTEARARGAGVTHYVWQTSGDADVRPGHRAMQGKICSWDEPPAVNENGRIMYHHPGRFPNCRCWPQPLLVPTGVLRGVEPDSRRALSPEKQAIRHMSAITTAGTKHHNHRGLRR